MDKLELECLMVTNPTEYIRQLFMYYDKNKKRL